MPYNFDSDEDNIYENSLCNYFLSGMECLFKIFIFIPALIIVSPVILIGFIFVKMKNRWSN